MPVTSAQKAAIGDVVKAISTTTASGRGRRHMATAFLQLVDREVYTDYYKTIPEPRCLDGVRLKNDKGEYDNVMDAYTDLSLIFWNAIYFNEPESQITSDAKHLKSVLESEWRKHPELPKDDLRASPPPRAPQKVNPPRPPPAPKAKAAPIYSTRSVNPGRNTREASTSDIDIDGDFDTGSGVDNRDDGDDEIVRALERGLIGWQGFGPSGWMSPSSNTRLREIIDALRTVTDPVGKQPIVALEQVPKEEINPHLSFHDELSLELIEKRVAAEEYTQSKDFDLDFARLFEKARRWHEPCTEPYSHILLLQRFYNSLTSSAPPEGPPYTSPTNFAFVKAGPGTARPLHSIPSDSEGASTTGVTTFRVSTKDRTFVDEVSYKGWSIRLADWVHLSNPDDPGRPIVAQVFKVWLSDEPGKKGQPGVTACWYYRPEQTIHPAQRRFWDGEVFKTGHFADHPLDDLIEKIACQFTARHIRGRPRPPYWYLTWPLYVCDSRYNDRERMFVKIKNWNSCVPEEVRKSTEFMPIYPFERTVYPRLRKSPFIEGRGNVPVVSGPGGIGESIEKVDGEADSTGPAGKKRSRRTADLSGPSRGGFGSGTHSATNHPFAHSNPHQPTTVPQASSRITPTFVEDRSVITAAGGVLNFGAQSRVQKLVPEMTKHFERDPNTNEVLWFSAAPLDIARPPKPQYSIAYLHFLAEQARDNSTRSKRQKTTAQRSTDGDVTMQDG